MYRNDLIRSRIVNLNLNITSFARESGLGLHTARKLWNGATNIELVSLDKASAFLKIPLETLFRAENPVQQPKTTNQKLLILKILGIPGYFQKKFLCRLSESLRR